jgi:hypothetical protein
MKYSPLLFLYVIISAISFPIQTIPMYFCTAASHNYFERLQNLIGSIHTNNFNDVVEIAVFNLGLTPEDVAWLKKIQKVSVYTIEQTHPDLLKPLVTHPGGGKVPGWYAWKPVIIKQSLDMFPYVLWMDAGMTVKKPLDNLFKHIEQNGYFLSTIGNEKKEDGSWRHPLHWGTTKCVIQKFNLDSDQNAWILKQEFVNAGVFGVSNSHIEQFIMPLYQYTKHEFRLFADDGTTPNGLGTGRHDQTLLSVLAYIQGLRILAVDYTQNTPAFLLVDNTPTPWYITWNADYVSQKTDIYHSRGDVSNKEYYMSNIRYKID